LIHAKHSANKSVYSHLRKSLKLIVDDVDEQSPQDIAYVYSGYAPLSVRLVQCIIQKHVIFAAQSSNTAQGRLASTLAAVPNAMGWRGFEEPLKLVKGRTFDEIQKQEDKAVRAKSASFICLPDPELLNGVEDKVSLVFFLGGCTYTEITAVRFIAQREGVARSSLYSQALGKRIIIATTGIINGKMMIHAALQGISAKTEGASRANVQ
jgi:vacuolar protein sorting-associated protein 33A